MKKQKYKFFTQKPLLFQTNIISDDDINKSLFHKFSFSGQKQVYAQMNRFSANEKYRKFENFKTFWLSPYGALGATFFGLIILAGLFIPFTTISPYETNPNEAFLDFGVNGHILGTDNLGRDIWARTWWGLRNSIAIGFAAVAADVFLGIVLGILMGYYRFFDRIFNFIIKILNSVPNIIILILVSIVLTANIGSIILGIIITGWIGMSLQVRAQVIQISGQNFVTSSKLLDTPNRYIMANFLPFLISNVLAMLIISIPGAILADTSLAFLGIVVPNLPTLGSTLSSALLVITIFPQQLLGPVFFLTFIIFNVRMISIGLTDVFRSSR